jgi:hypothetical protein
MWVEMDVDRVGSIFWISHFVVHLTALSEAMYSIDFDVCATMKLGLYNGVHYLDNKVCDVIDVLCNHEVKIL